MTLGRATGHDAAPPSLVGVAARTGWPPCARRVAARAATARGGARVDRPAVRAGPLDPGDGEAAGGEPVLGTAGEKSVRVTWDDVRAAAPDVVVVAPCGYDRADAQQQADGLVAAGAAAGRCRSSTPSTRTGCGPGPARGWWTASRSWRPCCIRDVTNAATSIFAVLAPGDRYHWDW